MRFLRQNTAVIITVGPFFDKTDGVTLETALTVTNERISFTVDLDNGSAPTLVLDNVTGAASGTSNDLNYITNCDAALMQLELAAANVNYVGRAFLVVTDAANHVPVFHEFTILPALVYDSLMGTDNLQVDAIQILGTAWAAPATAGLPDCNVKQISTDATAADNLESFVDGTGYAGTNNVIPVVTASGLSAAAVDAIWDEPVAGHTTASTFGKYLDSDISADAATSAALTLAAIADAIWDETKSGHVGATTFGDLATDLDTVLGYGAHPTPSAIADQVFDEVLSGHTTATTVGKAITDVLAFGTPPTSAANADAICDEIISTGHATANSLAKILYDNLNAPVGTVDTVVDTLTTNLADLHTDVGTVITNVGDVHATDLPAVKTVVDAVKVVADKLVFTVTNQVDVNVIDWKGTTAPAMTGDAYARLAATPPTAVENADALLKRDWTEITGGPAARSVWNALRVLRNAMLNTNATTKTITTEDDSTPAFTIVVSTDVTADPIVGTDPT